MAGVKARQWRKVAYARSGELYDVYGIRTSRVSIGRPPSLDRHDAQWSDLGNNFHAGRALVLNNVPRFWHVDSISNWASRFGTLKLIAVDYENSRAVIEFCDSKCAREAYESEPIGFCTNLYACYCERSREPLGPVLPPTNEHSMAATSIIPLHGDSWQGDKGLSPPLSPTLTEACSETADMEISILRSQQTFSLKANGSAPSTSYYCPSEDCARGMGLVSNGVLGSPYPAEGGDRATRPSSPTCTEGYSDDEDQSLSTPAHRLSCQIERKLQRQATLAEVKSFSLEVETILRGIEDSYRCQPSNFQELSTQHSKVHDKDKAEVLPAALPHMMLQVDLERPAYIQKIGNQLKDLLDIYDGVGTNGAQGTQLLESMRTIKRELDALDEEDKAFKKHKDWLASRTVSKWTRHRYPFAGWTAPLGNACTGPIDID